MTAILERTDPQLAGLIEAERARQHDTLCLIPSENHASAAVRAASASVLTDKYSEGYPGKRYYQGNAVIDEVETLAAGRARSLFGADHANVQALSARRRTWPPTPRCSSPGTRCWACRSTPAGT